MKPQPHSTPDSQSPHAFNELIEQFIAQQQHTPPAAAKCRRALDKLGRWLTKKQFRLQQIRPKHIKAFCTDQQNACAPHTLQVQIKSAYRPFFRWLKEEGIIQNDPIKCLPLPRPQMPQCCDKELLDQLLALSMSVPTSVLPEKDAIWIGFIVHVGFLLGMRREEIRAAQEEWFDFEARCVRIPSNPAAAPELQKVRVVPMSERLLSFLIIYFRVDPWQPRPDIANNPPKRKLRSPFRIFLDWAGKRLDQDLQWITPLVMRGTYAKHLLDSQVPRREIAQWMGIPETFVAKYHALLNKDPSG